MCGALAVLAAHTHAQTASAGSGQAYPAKPIRMVVPFAPGGTGECLARSITPRMGELIGQQFIVDFRGGAGTTLAAGLVAAAPADGYTVLIQTLTTQAINESLYSKLAYNTNRDFAPVGLIAVIPIVLAAHPSLPARSAKELAALSRARGQARLISALPASAPLHTLRWSFSSSRPKPISRTFRTRARGRRR